MHHMSICSAVLTCTPDILVPWHAAHLLPILDSVDSVSCLVSQRLPYVDAIGNRFCALLEASAGKETPCHIQVNNMN